MTEKKSVADLDIYLDFDSDYVKEPIRQIFDTLRNLEARLIAIEERTTELEDNSGTE